MTTEQKWRMLVAPAAIGCPLVMAASIHEGLTAAFWLSVIGAAAVIGAIGTWRSYEPAVSIAAGMMFVVMLDIVWSLIT